MREKRAGYWELRVFAGVDPLSGKRQYRTRTFRGTKRQAQSALACPPPSSTYYACSTALPRRGIPRTPSCSGSSPPPAAGQGAGRGGRRGVLDRRLRVPAWATSCVAAESGSYEGGGPTGSPLFRATSSSVRKRRTFALLSRRRPSHVIDTSSAVGEGARRTASASFSNLRSGAVVHVFTVRLSGCRR